MNAAKGAVKLLPYGCQNAIWDEATWNDNDYYPGILYLLEQFK